MNAALRLVADAPPVVPGNPDADAQTAQNLKQSLRLFKLGFIAGWVQSHTESGPVAFDLEQRLKWDERSRALAEAAYEAVYGRAS